MHRGEAPPAYYGKEEECSVANVVAFAPGGYRYIKAVFQYSGGVAAEPGFEIQRSRLEAISKIIS